MSKINIVELARQMQRLAEAATPGPWVEHTSYPDGKPSREIASVPAKKSICDMVYGSQADREFIAASRTNAPLLADAVIEMVAKLRTECYCTGYGEDPCDICEFLAKLGVTPTT